MQHRNFVGDVEHHVHVVLDQQDRELGIELHQKLGHLGRFARRQAGGGLVEQQDFRIAGEAEHDFELALLAVREIADLDILAVEEVGLFEQMMGLVVDFLVRRQEAPHHEFRRPQALDRQQHIVEHGQFGKQAGDLEGARHAERGAPVARPVGDVLAEQQHLSGGHRIDAGDQIEQRGLAGAVRADDGLAVARHDAQRDVARGLQAAEALAQALELENRNSPPFTASQYSRVKPSNCKNAPGLAARAPALVTLIRRTCRAGSRGRRPAAPGTCPCRRSRTG